LFILGLSVYVIVALGIEAIFPLDDGTRAILRYADTAICIIFLADFLGNVVKAESTKRYLLTWGWIDLLSSIPFVGPLRLGRAARAVRIIRVLRGFRGVKHLATYLMRRRAQAAFATVGLASILLVVFASIAVLQFEPAHADANIRTASDAPWWAWTTVTSVGYGDRYPITPEGRIIGAVLMTAGVGLFGTFTGFVASWFASAPAEGVIEADAPGTVD
jgi:voltage-gated potassium channel